MADGPSLMDHKEATRLRLELRQVARTPLRDVQADSLVKVRGFVSVDGQAVPAPVTATPCAIYCVDSKVVQRSFDWTEWLRRRSPHPAGAAAQQIEENWNVWPGWQSSPLPREIGGRDLLLNDGTGRVRVRIGRAQLSLLGNWRTSLATNRAKFLSTRGRPTRNHETELEYRELTVVPGEILTIYGRAIAEADPEASRVGPQPYRVAPIRHVFDSADASPLYIVQEHVVALDAVG